MTRQAALLLPLCLCCTALFAQQQNDVNVAPNKSYSQSTTYPNQGPSSRGANGNTSQFFLGNCIHTSGSDNNPWWQVDLGRTFPVRRIDVWSRFNFKNRLYPSTITVNNQTCASITDYPTDSRRKKVTCSTVMYGQKVRITRPGSEYLNMCEMQIWVPSEVSECEVGKYGPGCSSVCSSHCGKGQGKNFCYKSTGYCYDGCVDGRFGDQCSSRCSPGCQSTACGRQSGQCYSCKTGYEGSSCTECQHGYYKTPNGTCQRCSTNCQLQNCDKSTGKCNVCVDGRYGDQCTSLCRTSNCHRCDQDTGMVCSQCSLNSFLLLPACTDCTDGYYKQTIYGCQKCSENCKSGTLCDKTTGYCSMCPPGKQGNFCAEDCDIGSYGQNCTGQCGHCRRDSASYCQADTGHCVYGCLDGWQTQLCKTECQDGSYGPDCSHRCGQCKGGAACNKTDGHCSGCEAGWNLPKCNTECPDGWYGESCALECGSCFGGVACNKTNGHCRCLRGKQPPFCQTDCQGGRYGQDCAETCGHCRGGQTCNPTTGHCSTGCEPGWIDLPPSLNIILCKSECPEGFYGEDCNQTCGNCQNSTECRHDTGECTGHCSDGFTGRYCAQAVTDDGSATATIAGAVVAAVVVIVIVVLVVIIVMRRRTQSAKSNTLVAESSEMSNNSQNRRDPERSGASSLSFDSINSKRDKPSARLETHVKPVVRPADHGEGHVYENVSLPKQNSASKDAPTLPKQSNKKNGTANTGKQAKPREKTARSVPGTDNAAPAAQTSLTDDEELESMWTGEAIYSNDPSQAKFQPTPIRLDQLQKTIMSSVKDGTVSQEFGHLEGLKEYPVTHGKRQENYYKNRFNSILPYDKHRVVLDQVDGDDSSDYINASFIKGYKTEKAYIASQGPRPNTQDDFWRMVWQERITDIVMLTNTIEGGNKPKCHEYWPAEGSSLNTGHVQVTAVEEQERAHFVVRTFSIRTLQSKEKRQVRQYHYIKWMDHEVPATTPLVDFWRYVRARAPRTPTAPPLLVHCSAGVGRTGTYIALDILIDQSQQQQEISLYSTVDELRNYRCHMVQNKGQYEFLHEAVVEAYMSGDSRLDTSAFDNIFSLTIHHDQAHPRIDAEYERLGQMRTCFIQPCHSTANLDENRQKNRNPDILPDDKHLVFITEHVKGRNQYINAVYMPTFLSSRGSILTQLPLADTVVDLWRLVDSWDISTIVSIGQADGKTGMDCYWPRQAGQAVNHGAYTVSLLSKTSLGDNLNTYTVEMKKEGKAHELRVLHFEAWTGEVSDNIPGLINLLDTLHTAHKQAAKQPIIVQCIDGAAQSGALCVLWDVISRVMYDDDIDVYLAVRHVHTVRPEAINSVVQYRFIYEVIQEYRSSSNIYVNT